MNFVFDNLYHVHLYKISILEKTSFTIFQVYLLNLGPKYNNGKVGNTMKSRYFTFTMNLSKAQFLTLRAEIENYQIVFEVIKEYFRNGNWNFNNFKGDEIIGELVKKANSLNKELPIEDVLDWIKKHLNEIAETISKKKERNEFIMAARKLSEDSVRGLCHNFAFVINSHIRTKKSIKNIIDNKYTTLQNSVYFRLPEKKRIINGELDLPLLGKISIEEDYTEARLDPLWVIIDGYIKISFNEAKISFIPINGVDRSQQSKCEIYITAKRELYIKAIFKDKEYKELHSLEKFGFDLQTLLDMEKMYLKKLSKAKNKKERVKIIDKLETEVWEPIFSKWFDEIVISNPVMIKVPTLNDFAMDENNSLELNDILFITKFFSYLSFAGQKLFTVKFMK